MNGSTSTVGPATSFVIDFIFASNIDAISRTASLARASLIDASALRKGYAKFAGSHLFITVSLILILAYWPRGDTATSSLFGGMPGGYGLGAPHLPSAYAILGRGGSAPGFGGHTPTSAPPPSPYPHSSLGTLSVAASQAASLGK